MQLFLTSGVQDGYGVLDPGEAYHALRVLRMKVGDDLVASDGEGTFYYGQLSGLTEKHAVFRIHRAEKKPKPWARSLHIAISPTKQTDRFEFFLEKAVEIGVDEVTPLICARTERRSHHADRLRRIVLSAQKQSFQPWTPQINEPVDFNRFTQNVPPGTSRFMAYCEDRATPFLGSFDLAPAPLVILIGPEGDFSAEELEIARRENFFIVSLGPNRLRVETAGIAAVQIIRSLDLAASRGI